MAATLEVRILGPFEVRVDGGAPAALGGLRQRALLAVLCLHANQVISTDQLVDELWGEVPPATAVHTVQVFVSRLRAALVPAAERLVTRPPGYVLELVAGELDAGICERRYEGGRSTLRSGSASAAAKQLHDAESLWRGPPLADFTYEPFAQATIARLEELRTSCREELVDAELALGLHAGVVSRLEALVREQPYRERPRGQLMLALYRSGRQADALDAFQDARRVLVEELAVEPGDALRELEQAILRQDPALAAPATARLASDERPGQPEERSVRVADTASIAPVGAIAGALTRKTATILVARLTAMRHADPEVTKRAVAAAREQAEEIVRRHGGALVAAVAGELVWTFGVPMIKEDDALRAIRAAEDLRREVTLAIAAEKRQLTMRLALATGEVVAEGTADLFGEPLDEGMSLARAALAGEVLLDDATRRSVLTAVQVEPALDATAWRLLALAADGHLRRRVATMVGRDRELSSGLRVFNHAARSREAHLLTVIGEAGIGKSRLAQELAERLADEATVLTGRCLSYGEGIAFWPWREALTQATGGESQGAVRGLLGDAADADVVAGIIATTLRLAPGESVGEQVPWAFRRLLEELAARRPVMLVLEDGHWAEPPLLDLIDYLVDWLRAPVLVLCLARPELLDVRPSWGGGHARMSSLVLGPLGDADALALLEHQLGGRELTSAQNDEIIRTAEGNPLFVEQLRQARAEDPWWDRDQQIPATIQSLLAARLDRLGPGERAVIERGALIGREFWPNAVVELLPPDARPSTPSHLRALVHRGLIHPEQSILAGQEQLSFHHILIRDVAYSSSPKAVRSGLHERFAGWLAVHGSGYEEFIGYHLEQAFRYRRELDPLDAEALTLAARGGECLATAGRRALARGDVNPAVELLRSSAELIQASGGKRPDVLLDLGSALSEIDVPRAEPVLTAALEAALAIGEEALGARALIDLSYRRALIDTSVPVADMLSVAEKAVRVFMRAGDEGGVARAWHHVAMVHWIHSRCADMEEVLERALTHAERAGDQRMQARILGYLARATVTGPRPVDDGVRRCHAILARAGGDVGLIAVTETMLSVLDAMQGRFEEARSRWRQAKQRLEAVGLSVSVAKLQMYCAFVGLLAGTPWDAEPELAAAYAVLNRSGERGHLNSTAGLMARLLYAHGRHDECAHYCRISEETATPDDIVSQALWRGTKAKLLALDGKAESAKELADSAVEHARATDFLMLHGDALADRADVLAILGESDGAAADRVAARALYARKGMRIAEPGAAVRSGTTVTTTAD